MDELLRDLTDAQREAVLHVEGPLLILAGPGSGKTRVITHRIAHLLRQGILPENILALTFTNKAADEMRLRVERLVGNRGPWLGTFHRFCARLLRKYARFVGLEPNYTIYDAEDSLRLLRRTIAESGSESAGLSPEGVASAISWAKNNLLTPETYQPRERSVFGDVIKQIYAGYEQRLRQSNAVDFDDLLLLVALLLRDHPEIRADLDARYRYVMVDEYQDTNLAQYAIVRALSIDHSNLAVTGDPDQSIYGWRGANVYNILEFEKDYPSVCVIRLERNYRSSQRILHVAQELIRHNKKRKAKGLYTENGEGQPVRLVQYLTQKEEADDIAAQIARAVRGAQRRPRDFAVFYRINALSRSLEFALRDQGLPYQLIQGVQYFQRKEIKDVLSYLQLINNPRDEQAFLRIINTPPRGLGPAALARLRTHAARPQQGLLEAASHGPQVEGLSKRAASQIQSFVAMIDRLSALAVGPVEELMGQVLTQSGYRAHLTESENPEDQERLANVEELLTVAREFDQRSGGEGLLEAFLEESSLVNDTDDLETGCDRVTLMTLHASKGLEFPVVFLVAVEEGLLPHERSRLNEDQVEEERRLMFVGMTRAQQELQLSTAQYRDFRGQRKLTIPSQFLMELPREEMDLREARTTAPVWCEPTEPEEIPAAPTPNPARPLTIHLTTAAELANGGSSPVSPDVFNLGMLVRHPGYGLGRIVGLSGEGAKRRATVDFAGSAGQVKFVLAKSPLRPIKAATGDV